MKIINDIIITKIIISCLIFIVSYSNILNMLDEGVFKEKRMYPFLFALFVMLLSVMYFIITF